MANYSVTCNLRVVHPAYRCHNLDLRMSSVESVQDGYVSVGNFVRSVSTMYGAIGPELEYIMSTLWAEMKSPKPKQLFDISRSPSNPSVDLRLSIRANNV